MFLKGLLKYIIWTVILFGIGLGGAFYSMKVMMTGKQVQVPNLVGKDIVSALATLNEVDLRLKIARQEYNSTVAENHVISQQPVAGIRVKTGRDIKIVVSRGAELALIPDLTQENMLTVRLKLMEQGLKPGKIIYIRHPKEAEQVVAQFPPPGGRLARGKEVDLIVSQGPPHLAYLMPDMVGQPVGAAVIKLKSLGLEVSEPKYEAYPGLPQGTIISHSPWPGYRVQTGDTVTLVVSKG